MTALADCVVTKDLDRYNAELKHFRRKKLHIYDACVTTLQTPCGPAVLPVVTAAPRPDLVDLIRRHQPHIDGSGECRSQWFVFYQTDRLHESLVMLDVRFSSPALCSFTLEFSLMDSLTFLWRCVEVDSLCLTYRGATSPLYQGVGVPALAQPEFIAVLRAVRLMKVGGVEPSDPFRAN